MRLIGNKIITIEDKVYYGIYCKGDYIGFSKYNILYKQKLLVNSLTTSDYLKDNIYDEINRE